MNRKTVQIDHNLFAALCRFHLADDVETAEDIKKALEGKLEALVRHELYSKSKSDEDPVERERARLEYLDRIGIHPDFRW